MYIYCKKNFQFFNFLFYSKQLSYLKCTRYYILANFNLNKLQLFPNTLSYIFYLFTINFSHNIPHG